MKDDMDMRVRLALRKNHVFGERQKPEQGLWSWSVSSIYSNGERDVGFAHCK
jgi:hypothetical protein